MAHEFTAPTTSAPSSITDAAVIVKAYQDNVLYDLDNSLDMCRRFIQACRQMLGNPSEFSRGGASGHALKFDLQNVAKELRKAEQWYQNTSTSSAAQQSRGKIQYARFERD